MCQLASGMCQLASGMCQLANGMCQLANCVRQLVNGWGAGVKPPKNKIVFFSTRERGKAQHIEKSYPPFLSCFKNFCARIVCQTAGCLFGFADLLVTIIRD